MKVQIDPSWRKALREEFGSKRFKELTNFINGERQFGKEIYPESNNVFRAFSETPFDKVKVVILGQDPYHNIGQAQGLSFSVPAEINNPPSLVNIFKEIEADLGHKSKAEIEGKGDLSGWAKQGVLLLNTSLTVEAHKPASHSDRGWEELTDAAIRVLSEKLEGIVFLLWGNHARSKKELINPSKHLILEAPHPSPLSAHRGFFGCRHFSKANKYLKDSLIQW